MIRIYHNHKLQTNPWHREEEPQKTLQILIGGLQPIQTLSKTTEKFKKDPAKTVEVAFTKFCDGQSDGRTDGHAGNDSMSAHPDGGDIIDLVCCLYGSTAYVV